MDNGTALLDPSLGVLFDIFMFEFNKATLGCVCSHISARAYQEYEHGDADPETSRRPHSPSPKWTTNKEARRTVANFPSYFQFSHDGPPELQSDTAASADHNAAKSIERALPRMHLPQNTSLAHHTDRGPSSPLTPTNACRYAHVICNAHCPARHIPMTYKRSMSKK